MITVANNMVVYYILNTGPSAVLEIILKMSIQAESIMIFILHLRTAGMEG